MVALLRAQLDDMRNTLERTRNDADTWRKAFEDERGQRTLPASSHPTQLPSQQPMTWWRWLRTTG